MKSVYDDDCVHVKNECKNITKTKIKKTTEVSTKSEMHIFCWPFSAAWNLVPLEFWQFPKQNIF